MPGQARRAVLRDYYGPHGARVVALADWEGEPESRPGLFYRLGNRIVNANNELIARFTGIPGQFRDNFTLLRDPVQRKLLARALVDERLLTARRRKAIFSMLLWGTLFLYAAVGAALVLLRPQAIGAYQSLYSLFFYAVATSLFLPTPFEFLLPSARHAAGTVATILVASLAKTAGSWLVLLMGDKANAGIKSLLERRVLLARLFHGLERFAQRFGYVAVFALFAIPFMTDTAPLFVLAVLRMRKLPFLATMFAAIATRSLIFLLVF